VDPQVAAGAVVAAWRRGDLTGLRLGGLTGEEAMALERPAMTYVREQLRQRLARQIDQAHRWWLHPTSGRRPGDRFLQQGWSRFLPCVCCAAARLNPEPTKTSSLLAATGPLQQTSKIVPYGDADLGRMA
jgi:hypothetical protein